MDTTVDREKTGKGLGLASLIMGIGTWVIYLVVIAGFFILSSIGTADALALGEVLSFAAIPFVCIGVIANAVGVVLGVVAFRRDSARQEKRRWRIAVALNGLPAILYCAMGLFSSIWAVTSVTR